MRIFWKNTVKIASAPALAQPHPPLSVRTYHKFQKIRKNPKFFAIKSADVRI